MEIRSTLPQEVHTLHSMQISTVKTGASMIAFQSNCRPKRKEHMLIFESFPSYAVVSGAS